MISMNKEQIRDRLYLYWLLGRFDKPIGIFILLWPTLWALWVAAEGRPSFHVLLVFIFGVVLMRAAGCIINDYADREFDPHVERTRQRPIASGKVKPKEALILFCVLSLVAFLLVLTLNSMTIKLSFIGVFLAASYPFMKRYTHLPQAYLGIAFGWAVPMAFAAQIETIPLVAWLMYLSVALWALVYDTMYALVDYDDDLKIGVKSTAILFGDRFREIIAAIQVMSLGLLVWVGYLEDLTGVYYIGLIVAFCLSVYQQRLIFYRNKDNCFKAFLNNNWYGLAVFIGLVLHYIVV